MPNFLSANEGAWFYFVPENEELGGVCLRELSLEESNRIEKLTVKHNKKVIRGILVDDKEEDTALASNLRWDYCITDWKEVHLDGELLECNSKNKVRMMKVTDFVKFIADSINKLIETNRALEEAQLKNSPNSSHGNSENPDARTA